MELSESEKLAVKKRLETLAELELKYDKLKADKKKISMDIKPLRQVFDTNLQKLNKRFVETDDLIAERVCKTQRRKPSLKMTYNAISTLLGPQVLEEVKKEVDLLRAERKRTAAKQESLLISKTGDARKTRCDKIPEDQKPPRKKYVPKPKQPAKPKKVAEPKPPKRKFLRREDK